MASCPSSALPLRRLLMLGAISAPLMTSAALAQIPLLTYTGDTAHDNLGRALAGVGDVDDDGREDFALSIPGYGATAISTGRIQVFSGATGNLLHDHVGTISRRVTHACAAGDVDGDSHDDYWYGHTYDGTGTASLVSGASGTILRTSGALPGSGFFGTTLADAGDLDGDNVRDLIAGQPDFGTLNRGAVVAFSGQDGSQIWFFSGSYADGAFGSALACAGDVDMDGRDDVIVGAHWAGTSSLSGRAYVYSGADGSLLHTFAGSGMDEILGASVAGAGDVDGDGHADVLIGSPQADAGGGMVGAARVFSGADGSVLREHWGQGSAGAAVDGGRDVDNDGHADYVFGDPTDPLGGSTARGRVSVRSGLTGAELFAISGAWDHGWTGQALALTGDADGDGLADLLVGTWQASANGTGSGEATLFVTSCPTPQVVCDGVANSTGSPAVLSCSTPSLSLASISLRADSVPQHEFGYLLVGQGRSVVSGPGGSAGDLCLGGAPIGRYAKDVTSSGSAGVLLTDVLNAVTGGGGGALPPALGGSLEPGSNWVFQYWFRDGPQSNFSSALSVTFCP